MAAERDGARTTGTVVHKVLNNNVVISIDEAWTRARAHGTRARASS